MEQIVLPIIFMSSNLTVFGPDVVLDYNQRTAGVAGSQTGRSISGQTSRKAYTSRKEKCSVDLTGFATNHNDQFVPYAPTWKMS